jgi:hypothetical protein
MRDEVYLVPLGLIYTKIYEDRHGSLMISATKSATLTAIIWPGQFALMAGIAIYVYCTDLPCRLSYVLFPFPYILPTLLTALLLFTMTIR